MDGDDSDGNASPMDDEQPPHPEPALAEEAEPSTEPSHILRRIGRRDTTEDDAYRNGGFGSVPASTEAIASLPEATVVTEMMEDECAVCFENYEGGDKLRAMSCSHGFHEGCIVKWLGISRLCPLCRFKLPAE
ncbi:hypothetical protein BAE44_0004004 [Dichanthelium oligosanthes]|uniref:RING-type domain-containing protein n=1 Tax=Dichanthelium oligosanthes TaxID=888268 RepID=A0A1E5WC62_9POAL|nr:hypothetical protein BAE44_0004004 [Dichanthelium oligosanthes]